VSASVNFPLHDKVQKFCFGTGAPGWSRKRGRKRQCGVVCVTLSVTDSTVRRTVDGDFAHALLGALRVLRDARVFAGVGHVARGDL